MKEKNINQDLSQIEKERGEFINEQETRADKRNKLRTYPDRWLRKNKVDYVAVVQEEAQKMNDLAELKVVQGEEESYQEAIEKLMHLDEFQLKDEKQIIEDENWKNLPAEATYSKAENPKTEIPVFLMPGWANTPGITFKKGIDELNDLGRDVLSVETTRIMEILNTEDEKSGKMKVSETGEEHEKVEIQKAMAILKVLEEKNIEKTDLLLYSESCINGLIAASMQPEKFRKIIMAMPAGLIGKDTFPKLAGRFLKELLAGGINIAKDLKKPKFNGFNRFKRSGTYGHDITRYILKNPLLAYKEVSAIANSDTGYMVKNLEEQGIEIEIITGSNDPAFPPERIKKNNPDLLDNIHMEDGEYGSHGEIFMDPKFMEIINKYLDK